MQHNYLDYRIKYLTIKTWSGVSPGAQHSYGYFHYYHPTKRDWSGSAPEVKSELSYPVTSAYVKKLNQAYEPRIYKVGSRSTRFFSHEDIYKAAIRRFFQFSEKNRVCLILSSPDELARIIVGPRPWMLRMNELVEQFDKLGRWSCSDKDMDEVTNLARQWEECFCEHIPRIPQ